MLDVCPRGSLIKKTAEVVVLRGRRRRRVHCKRINSPSHRLAPPATPAPFEAPAPAPLPFINSSALLSLVLWSIAWAIANQVPHPQPHRSRASHSKRFSDFGPHVEHNSTYDPFNPSMDQQDPPIPIASSSNGRVSGKPWKIRKTPTMCVLQYIPCPRLSFPSCILQSVTPAAGFKIGGLPR